VEVAARVLRPFVRSGRHGGKRRRSAGEVGFNSTGFEGV
jgi:hypothetical protein